VNAGGLDTTGSERRSKGARSQITFLFIVETCPNFNRVPPGAESHQTRNRETTYCGAPPGSIRYSCCDLRGTGSPPISDSSGKTKGQEHI